MLTRHVRVGREVGSYAADRKPIVDALLELARLGALVLAGVALSSVALSSLQPRRMRVCSFQTSGDADRLLDGRGPAVGTRDDLSSDAQ